LERDERRALAYVLRLWRVTNGEPAVWRAALQDLRSGERRGFVGLGEVVRYLERQMAGQEDDLGDCGPPHPGKPRGDAERR
jgi:hypothetical protein